MEKKYNMNNKNKAWTSVSLDTRLKRNQYHRQPIAPKYWYTWARTTMSIKCSYAKTGAKQFNVQMRRLILQHVMFKHQG